ncbi:MAG: nuclear transport factor 2 family protein [Candidatus Entotheonellia bacterium]
MIAREWALAFAREWIEAWNSHDMNRILSHYTDDFELSSPLIVERLSQSQGVLRGKDAVREYWRPSLSLDPPLQFELIDVLVGVAQITLYYRNVGRRVVAETLFIDGSGKATRGFVQWSVQTQDPKTSERGHPRMPALQTSCSRAR